MPEPPPPAAFPSPKASPAAVASRYRVCPACSGLNAAADRWCTFCDLDFTAPRSAEATGARWGSVVLLGATTLVFAGQMWVSWRHERTIPLLGAGSVDDAMRFGAMRVARADLAREPWRLLSATFVHFGALHYGSNMLGYYWLARLAEPAIGPERLVIAYILAGLAGWTVSALRVALEGGPPSIHGGASGAVFGLMGVVLGWFLRTRDPRWKAFALQGVLGSLLFGFVVNAVAHVVYGAGATIAIDNAAHVGGLLAGLVAGLIYAGPTTAPRWTLQAGAATLLAATGIALILPQL